jgi:hypothetical protein
MCRSCIDWTPNENNYKLFLHIGKARPLNYQLGHAIQLETQTFTIYYRLQDACMLSMILLTRVLYRLYLVYVASFVSYKKPRKWTKYVVGPSKEDESWWDRVAIRSFHRQLSSTLIVALNWFKLWWKFNLCAFDQSWTAMQLPSALASNACLTAAWDCWQDPRANSRFLTHILVWPGLYTCI